MAKRRRTKKDKIIAQLRRQVRQTQGQKLIALEKEPAKQERNEKQSGEDTGLNRVEKKARERKVQEKQASLYMFDPKLIRRDLLKTVILSGLALGLIFGLNFYWS